MGTANFNEVGTIRAIKVSRSKSRLGIYMMDELPKLFKEKLHIDVLGGTAPPFKKEQFQLEEKHIRHIYDRRVNQQDRRKISAGCDTERRKNSNDRRRDNIIPVLFQSIEHLPESRPEARASSGSR